VDTGADFDWEARETTAAAVAAAATEPEPEPESEPACASDGAREARLGALSAAAVTGGEQARQWELNEEGGFVVCRGARVLTYEVIRRSVAFRSIA
jgi:hypothetical protein